MFQLPRHICYCPFHIVNVFCFISVPQDVLNQICTPSGNVVRIVVFKKNGVQAMIEFETLDDAKRAKEALNGADIYSGCCTLKIEYAKVSRVLFQFNSFKYAVFPCYLFCIND